MGDKFLLVQTLGMTSGLKYIDGECLLEAGFLPAVVQSAAAGLAKRLKAATPNLCPLNTYF